MPYGHPLNIMTAIFWTEEVMLNQTFDLVSLSNKANMLLQPEFGGPIDPILALYPLRVMVKSLT